MREVEAVVMTRAALDPQFHNWKSSMRYLGVKASIIVVIVLGKLIVSSRTL